MREDLGGQLVRATFLLKLPTCRNSIGAVLKSKMSRGRGRCLFGATGYWVSTVGRDEGAVRKDIREQEDRDRHQDKLFDKPIAEPQRGLPIRGLLRFEGQAKAKASSRGRLHHCNPALGSFGKRASLMAAEQANTATSVGNQLLKMTLCPYRRSIDVSPAFFTSPELKQRRHTN